jgi:pentatricopeptide repeat protein
LSSDVQEVYEALSSPVQVPDAAGVSYSSRASSFKLSPDYLKNLKLKFEVSSALPGPVASSSRPTPVDDRIKNPTSSSQTTLQTTKRIPSIPEISNVIHLNALAQRPVEAQKAFDLLQNLGLKPDLIAYNHLMDAYSRAKNVEKVEQIFNDLKNGPSASPPQKGEASKDSLQPDMVTYSTLIKTLVNANQTRKAFSVYDEMTKVKKIPANRIIFTTLIKGALRDKDVDRAWKTFDHMRSQVCEPDTVTYSLMIYACSKTQDAEKAFDLFEEMASKSLPVSEATFVSLIQACGSRPDYYLEAFNLFDQMVRQGYTPTHWTYNTLLSAVAKQGDILRARLIWNQMISQYSESLDSSWPNGSVSQQHEPSALTFTQMFLTYAKAISKTRRMNSQKVQELNSVAKESALEARETPQLESELLSDSSLVELDSINDQSQGDELCDSESLSSTANEEGLVPASPNSLFLKNPDRSPKALLQEAQKLWHFLNHPVNSNPILPLIEKDAKLLSAYLSVLTSYPNLLSSVKTALEFLNHTDSGLVVSENGYNRRMVLHAITKNKAAFKEFGHQFWADFMDWDAKKEAAFEASAEPLSPHEKERVRYLEGRSQDVMIRAVIDMIQGHTRVGEFTQALDLIEQAQSFRENGYLRPIFFRDVWNLVEALRDEAEDGKWEGFKRIMALCAKPESNPLQVVRSTLKLRNLPKNWWGWRALGMDEDELRRIQKRNVKQKQRMFLRNWAKGQKAHKPVHRSSSR